MVLKRINADYKEKTAVTEFIGNPLIAALPDTVSQQETIKNLTKLLPIREQDREQDPQIRLEMLSRIYSVHIPFSNDLFIARSLSRCINWGYVSRNPMPYTVVEQVMKKNHIAVTPDTENYLSNAVFPIYGFSVLGISGVGKSCSVLNALRQFPQVIDHREYEGESFIHAQIVWLKVVCPGDGSPKGLCISILNQLDKVLGTNYSDEITSRISKDVITARVRQCVLNHHLGVLIIDDIQNLCGAAKDTTTDMLSFLIYLMEMLTIPVVMIGTPKVLPLFQQEFQLAKRATGDGTVQMSLFKENSSDWNRFIRIIWMYQFTASPVPLTEEMNHVFFEESVGNPFLCSLLYKLVQDDAITSGVETFTIHDVKKVAKDKLCITNTMRENMLHGTDEELKRYEYLLQITTMPPEEELSGSGKKSTSGSKNVDDRTTEYIASKLVERFKINIQQATKLAWDSMTACYGREAEEILGYAIKLCEIALAEEEKQKENTGEKNSN